MTEQPMAKPENPKVKRGVVGKLFFLLIMLIIAGLAYLFIARPVDFQSLIDRGSSLVGYESPSATEQPATAEESSESVSAAEASQSSAEQTSEGLLFEEYPATQTTADAKQAEPAEAAESTAEAQSQDGGVDSGELAQVTPTSTASVTEEASEAEEATAVVSAADQAAQQQADYFAQWQSKMTQSADSIKLGEAQSLAKLANQVNLLSKDASSAYALLEASDAALAEVSGQNVTEVRAQLNDAITALKAASKMDIEGMYLKLDSAAKTIAQLPMQSKVELADVAAEQEPSFIKKALNTLFTIKQVSEPIQPLRTAEDEFLIKQHFALTVAQAKLALMQKQPAIFASSVAESAAVLEQNFSADNPTVQSVVESLQGLQSQELWPKKVDLSEIVASISALSAE